MAELVVCYRAEAVMKKPHKNGANPIAIPIDQWSNRRTDSNGFYCRVYENLLKKGVKQEFEPIDRRISLLISNHRIKLFIFLSTNSNQRGSGKIGVIKALKSFGFTRMLYLTKYGRETTWLKAKIPQIGEMFARTQETKQGPILIMLTPP